MPTEVVGGAVVHLPDGKPKNKKTDIEINDPKGDLEVIVNYMDRGLVKTRMKDVKMAEMPVALRELFLSVLQGIVSSSQGKIPKNFFPVYGDRQFKDI